MGLFEAIMAIGLGQEIVDTVIDSEVGLSASQIKALIRKAADKATTLGSFVNQLLSNLTTTGVGTSAKRGSYLSNQLRELGSKYQSELTDAQNHLTDAEEALKENKNNISLKTIGDVAIGSAIDAGKNAINYIKKGKNSKGEKLKFSEFPFQVADDLKSYWTERSSGAKVDKSKQDLINRRNDLNAIQEKVQQFEKQISPYKQ